MTDVLKAHVLAPSEMDLTVRPQDDFFRYVNGSWLQTHEIPADRPMDGAFYALADLSEKRGHAIVEDAVAGKISDGEAKKIATLYYQFMDEKQINALGFSPISHDLQQIQEAADHTALTTLAGSLMRGSISLFFNQYVSIDPNDTTRYMLSLTQSGLGLPDESYYREAQYAPIREAYLAYIARILSLAKVAHTPEEAASFAHRIMDFETKLASHQWDNVTNRDPHKQDNPCSWEQIRKTAPGFDWNAWAEAIGLPLSKVQIFNLNQPDYFTAAAQLWKTTQLDDLKLWISTALISSEASLLSTEFVDTNFNFYSHTLAGTPKIRARWKRGLALVESAMGEALGKIYVDRHFPPESKKKMEILVQNILDAYRDSITDLPWMSEKTKKCALEKLETFTTKIGYPNTWKDYSGLDVSPENTLVSNLRRAAEFSLEYEWNKLDKPIDRDEWLMTPQTVNAYYYPNMNEIVFPAAILQPPFFTPEASDAVNYGAIGAVIGHEIGHGFDDQGSQFDGNGALNNWWTEKDREEFTQRTQALIEQYNEYIPAQLAKAEEEHHVNGALTIGENIGDLGGLSIAWKAWNKSRKNAKVSPSENTETIDGITAPQQFFYSWARIWRTKMRDEFSIQLLAIDPHSPAEFRCNGVLRNLAPFIETFDVKPGDALWLDPDKRVIIW